MKPDSMTRVLSIPCHALFLVSLLAAGPALAEEPAKKEPSAEPAPKEEPPPPKRRVKVRVPPGEEPDAPPKKVKLPGPGEHPAEDILALAGKLHGRPVRFESERARETLIEISDEIANEEVGIDEMTVLLAAHRIYIFPIVDPREGKVLVVSRNPAWKDEPASFTKVIECSPRDFPHVEEEVTRAVKKKNAALPAGAPRVVAVASPRTGKIFIRAGSKEDLEEVSRAGSRANPSQAAAEKKRDEERHRLYTYLGQHRKVEDLEEELLEKLEEGERNLLRIVITSKGNRLLYRCPAKLGDKVKAILESLDKPPAKESKKQNAPGKPPGGA